LIEIPGKKGWNEKFGGEKREKDNLVIIKVWETGDSLDS
jgi:hypothetical protein